MQKLSILVIILSVVFSGKNQVMAQACCTAGTPLMNALDVSATPGGVLNISLTYDYNVLEDAIDGSEKIEAFRNRVSKSFILDLSYGLNQRLSFTSLLTFTQHTRMFNHSNPLKSAEKVSTRGIGDALLLAKYNILPLDIISQRELALGIGLKLPLGASTLKNGDVLLAADMQPGTGSWDGFLWGSFFQGFLPLTRFNFFVNGTYRFNGTNDRYRLSDIDSGYKFGNEIILSAGAAYSTESLFNFTLVARYRNTQPDMLGSAEVPNTGGNWIYLVPGININLKPLTYRISGQLPAYRQLNGIQLTTTYSVSIAVFYSI